MNILALDTATEACSAAVLTPRGEVARYAEVGRGHSERILTMIDEVLSQASLALGDLDAIAFGRGPGSFTGVRLAASVAQGLAFGAGLGVVPISNLRALAQRVLDIAPAAGVLVCADARMKEVYSACYRRGPRGLAQAYGPAERVSAPDAVALPPEAAGPMHGAGGGFRAYPQLAARLGQRLETVHGDLLPRAGEIARLAVAELAAGRILAPEQALPTYLRDDVVRPPRG
jgi:tRNA threonylcarbamoyladenosine biosynthesis protein TsaB